MHLINDVHAVLKFRRSVDDLIADITNIVNAIVGCGVHFQDVGGTSRVDGAAGGTDTARACGGGVLTVDCLSQNFGAGGLTRSARTTEKIGVGKFPGGTFVFQNGGDMILPANLIKITRSPLTVEGLMHGK